MADGDKLFEGMTSWATVSGIACAKATLPDGSVERVLQISILDASGISNFMFKLADAGQLGSEIFFKLSVFDDPTAKKVNALLEEQFGKNRRDPDAPPD